MSDKDRKDFCIECRKDTEYVLKKKNIKKLIRDKEYEFVITVPICTECGEEMSPKGIFNINSKEIDEQYRKAEGIISVGDIEKMMKVYKIGKAPLSLALGFGEITVTRYLSGMIPSKEYSDIMKDALSSPSIMKGMLLENKDKIADVAYSKAVKAADELEPICLISDELRSVIANVFEKLGEVTPLMLQKILYYIQGISSVLCGKPIFFEECQAWVHGPVYPQVYNIFRDFKYNPIEDDRFVIFLGKDDVLTEDEIHIINLVTDTFGLYSGRTLEMITHAEEPWKKARRGYEDSVPSNNELSKESIKEYFESVNKEYNIGTEKGLNEYIKYMLNCKL